MVNEIYTIITEGNDVAQISFTSLKNWTGVLSVGKNDEKVSVLNSDDNYRHYQISTGQAQNYEVFEQ